MGTLSDRERYVTDLVAEWISSDGDYFDQAQSLAREGSWSALGDFLMRIVRSARPYSAPWHVAQEMAPNDWARVDWPAVLAALSDH